MDGLYRTQRALQLYFILELGGRSKWSRRHDRSSATPTLGAAMPCPPRFKAPCTQLLQRQSLWPPQCISPPSEEALLCILHSYSRLRPPPPPVCLHATHNRTHSHGDPAHAPPRQQFTDQHHLSLRQTAPHLYTIMQRITAIRVLLGLMAVGSVLA